MPFYETDDKNLANVKIDRSYYYVYDEKWLTAPLLREISSSANDRDMWEIVPGACDRKVDVYNSVPHYPKALRQFFTAPRYINSNLCPQCVGT